MRFIFKVQEDIDHSMLRTKDNILSPDRNIKYKKATLQVGSRNYIQKLPFIYKYVGYATCSLSPCLTPWYGGPSVQIQVIFHRFIPKLTGFCF